MRFPTFICRKSLPKDSLPSGFILQRFRNRALCLRPALSWSASSSGLQTEAAALEAPRDESIISNYKNVRHTGYAFQNFHLARVKEHEYILTLMDLFGNFIRFVVDRRYAYD